VPSSSICLTATRRRSTTIPSSNVWTPPPTSSPLPRLRARSSSTSSILVRLLFWIVSSGSSLLCDVILRSSQSLTFGTVAVRHVPSWMPGAGFQRKAASWRSTLQRMADVPHAFVKRRMVCVVCDQVVFSYLNHQQADGTNVPNFTSGHLEQKNISAEEEDIIKWAAASLYSGGADTVRCYHRARAYITDVQLRRFQRRTSSFWP
jgi:hypothetical protein